MSMETAEKYLRGYRLAKTKALTNEARSRWFTSDVKTLAELKTTVFDRGQERTAWAKAYLEKGKLTALLPAALGIDFLASCLRDLRIQFMAGGYYRPRTDLDHDRFEIMRASTALLKTKALAESLKPPETK